MDSQVIRRAKMRTAYPNSKFIQDIVESPKFRKGAFTKKAKSAGHTTARFMRMVLENPEDFDETTVRQARFMKTLVSFNK